MYIGQKLLQTKCSNTRNCNSDGWRRNEKDSLDLFSKEGLTTMKKGLLYPLLLSICLLSSAMLCGAETYVGYEDNASIDAQYNLPGYDWFYADLKTAVAVKFLSDPAPATYD